MYAFGVLMWEIYNGGRAWEGLNHAQVLYFPILITHFLVIVCFSWCFCMSLAGSWPCESARIFILIVWRRGLVCAVASVHSIHNYLSWR